MNSCPTEGASAPTADTATAPLTVSLSLTVSERERFEDFARRASLDLDMLATLFVCESLFREGPE